jgi:ABC-type sugar transport system ATPase subunit
MIAGLESVTDGQIHIGDRDVTRLDPGARDISMVFQDYALYPHMTVRGNIAFCLENQRLPKDEVERRVREAAEVLHIEDLLDRKPAQLSGGQRQRVAIGRAIVRRPAVSLMDEPLSNLDAKLRVRMRREIAALHERLQITTVYVTHDQREAMTLADRIVVLDRGGIQQIGTPRAIYDAPANRFTAGFVGSPSMNFVVRGDRIVGVRPEHLRAPRDGEEPLVEGTVEMVEFHGATAYAHIRCGEDVVVAVVDPDEVPERGSAWAGTAPERRRHVFDAGTGLRVSS